MILYFQTGSEHLHGLHAAGLDQSLRLFTISNYQFPAHINLN